MPATNYGEQQQIANLFGKANQNPTNYSIGLINVDLVWTPSTVISSAQVSAGYYCIATNFNTSSSTPCRAIFKATAAGTTSSSAQPSAWTAGTQTAGGTYTDGTVTWTEQTNAFFNTSSGTWQGPEVGSGLGYSRATLANTQTGSTWSTPSLASTPGTSVTWQSAINFGTSAANTSWKYLAGYVLFGDAGNAWHYGLLNSYLAVLSGGIAVSIPTSPSPVTVTLT